MIAKQTITGVVKGRMELSDLRKLQLLEVNLLLKFQEICKENNLTYYLMGGGLIGALRHKGFIPWDDDLDIVMPRDDYDMLLRICNKGIAGGYGLVNSQTDFDANWHMPFSKIIDLQSEIEKPMAFQTVKDNVWIDIFPVDGTPNNKFRRWLHMKHVLFLRYILILTDINNLSGKKKRPFYEDWILTLFTRLPIFKQLNTEKVEKMMEKSMRKYDYSSSVFCCNYIGRYRSREIHPQKRWGQPASLLFEGIEVKVPQMYHELLTQMYGDYMKLPPKNQRVVHEVRLLNHRDIDFEAYNKKR